MAKTRTEKIKSLQTEIAQLESKRIIIAFRPTPCTFPTGKGEATRRQAGADTRFEKAGEARPDLRSDVAAEGLLIYKIPSLGNINSMGEKYHGFTFAHRGGAYRCQQHNSLAVKDDSLSWYWHSRGLGGFGVLDYLVKTETKTVSCLAKEERPRRCVWEVIHITSGVYTLSKLRTKPQL